MMTRAVAAVFAAITLAYGADDPLKTLRPNHPRLIALDRDIERVRFLIQQNPLARRLHADLVKEADRLLSVPPVEYKMQGPRLLPQGRLCLDRIYTLALLYRLDARKPYLDRALRELHAAADFKDWNPSHFLDTSDLIYAFAIGYDWLYPSLSSEDRIWIRTALVEKGLNLALLGYEAQAPWVSSRFSNNPICNGGIAMGALAVADEEPEKSRVLLRNALESIPRALASYGPDGGWPEGPGYWHPATSYFASFFAAVDSALGTDFGLSDARAFDSAGRFRVYFTGPLGRTFNYGDTRDRVDATPEMFWLARRFSQPVFAWQEHKVLEAGPPPDPLDLVWFQPDARSPKQENWPLNAIFHGVQVAFLRSAWEDPNALFVGAKGGDNKTNHGHLDLGTFVLDGGGVRWALESPGDDSNPPAPGGRPRFADNRPRSEWHNTLLIDDENQDVHAEAPISSHFFSPDLSWVEIDLLHAYPHHLKQFRRKIGIAQGQQVFLEDSLTSDQPVDALWGMLTDATLSLDGQTAELTKNGWTLSAEIVTPRHAVFDTVSLPAPPQPANPPVKRLVVRLGEKVTDLDLKITLTLHRTGQPKPKITPVVGS